MLNNQDGIGDFGREVFSIGSILILEDEIMVSIVIEELVRDMGASEILVLADPERALEAVETAPPDLAILDVHLGNQTSFAVADALAARNVPFLFSTALADVGIDERHRDRPVLGKPFSDAELRTRLLGLLRP